MQPGVRGADEWDGGELRADGGGLLDDVAHERVTRGDLGLGGRRIGAVEGGERVAGVRPERVDLVVEVGQVGGDGIEARGHLGIAVE
jgi:hypothetical protein